MAVWTISRTERLWPRWMTSAPLSWRSRRTTLIAASWPSNSDAAVTNRTGWDSFGTIRSIEAVQGIGAPPGWRAGPGRPVDVGAPASARPRSPRRRAVATACERRIRPEEADVDRAALHDHLVERVEDVGEREGPLAVAFDPHLRGATHELLDEGRADARGPTHDVLDHGVGDGEAAGVEVDQSTPPRLVGERELDRLIDAARTRDQGGLEHLGPVRREDEDHVGVGGEAVHLVEQPVQQRHLARPELVALSADEVDVLHHDEGGLQQPGERHVLREQPHLLRRHEQRGPALEKIGRA